MSILHRSQTAISSFLYSPTFWSYFRNRSGGRWMWEWGALHDDAYRRRQRQTRWNWHWQHQAATMPHVRHKSRLLSDNGSGYVAGELAEWIGYQGMSYGRGAPFHPRPNARSSAGTSTEEPRAVGELLPTRRCRTPDRGVHRALQPLAHAPLARLESESNK